jgi:hypothetical protein
MHTKNDTMDKLDVEFTVEYVKVLVSSVVELTHN